MSKKKEPTANGTASATDSPQVDAETNPQSNTASGPVDGLALWGSESATTHSQPLSKIQLGKTASYLVPFTVSMERVQLHYCEDESIHDYVRCSSENCLLCRLEIEASTRDLLPVYDTIAGEVGVLPITPNLRLNALRPQLVPILESVAKNDGELIVMSVAKVGKFEFEVELKPLPDNANNGAQKIKKFLDRYDAGELKLAAIYQQIANTELAKIEEYAQRMAIEGIVV